MLTRAGGPKRAQIDMLRRRFGAAFADPASLPRVASQNARPPPRTEANVLHDCAEEKDSASCRPNLLTVGDCLFQDYQSLTVQAIQLSVISI